MYISIPVALLKNSDLEQSVFLIPDFILYAADVISSKVTQTGASGLQNGSGISGSSIFTDNLEF